ncbi:hypothetical protein QEN19_001230 [Hanseniaspora menglaensis]
MQLLSVLSCIYCLFISCMAVSDSKPKVETKGFLTIKHGDDIKGNITVGLYDAVTPNTVANFKALLKNNDSSMGLINSTSNRIIANFMAQFGFLNNDRAANYHIFQDQYPDPQGFPDEKGGLALNHNKYQLSMANRGKNTNSCQFFITFQETSWLDGGYVVFGEVIDGFEVVDYLNAEVKTSRGDKPVKEVKVVACGVIQNSQEENTDATLEQLDEL